MLHCAWVRAIMPALAVALALAPAAAAQDAPRQTLSKSEFTAEIQKIWDMKDQHATAGYETLLTRGDLTEGQVRFVQRALIDQRKNKGDDMAGALRDLKSYVADNADTINEAYLRDGEFFLGQLVATADRVAKRSPASDAPQYLSDVWALGYWSDAVALLRANLEPGEVLLEDMERTGQLCQARSKEDADYTHNLNGRDHDLSFCPDNHTPLYASPQPFQGDKLRQTAQDLWNEARSYRSTLSAMRMELNKQQK
ncbi:MAG: hypothetical protein R3C52_03870 [Hyphomonadaceae bacterium]